METKVNYVIVGVFVTMLSAALIAGVLWLSTGKQYRKQYDTYLAYMSESVSGLNTNAPVKYRGVEVGRVRDISLDPANAERVRLTFDIERGTPIKMDTVAVLRSQGLTGIAFVELNGSSRESPLLKPERDGEPPVIKTGPSLLARLDTAATNLVAGLEHVTANVNALLDEDNRRTFKRLLADSAKVADAFARNSAAIDAGVRSAGRTLENSAQATAELTQLIERLGRSAGALEKMASDVSRASASTGKTMESVGGGAERLLAESQPELASLLREMHEAAASLRRVSEQLERNPSVLVRGRALPPPGPGEQ